MPRFLIQPGPIDGYEVYLIHVNIHLGIIKIPTKEILEDGAINNAEAIIVETDTKEVLNRLQTAFAREFEIYKKLRESDIRPTDFTTRQQGQELANTSNIQR